MSDGFQTETLPGKVLEFQGEDAASMFSASASATSVSSASDRWQAYNHRLDRSVHYEAKKVAGGYEVKQRGSPDDAAWTLDASFFEETYEIYDPDEEGE